MKLSDFNVVQTHDASVLLGDPLIHYQAAKQLVLAFVSRQGLMDYFRVSSDKKITLQQWNLVLDANLEAFARIIERKFGGDEWDLYERSGGTYPRVVITEQDMRRSGEPFTIDVLDLDAGFRSR